MVTFVIKWNRNAVKIHCKNKEKERDTMYEYTPSPAVTIIQLVLAIFYLVCMWKIYEKADYPGFAAIIPIYNIYVMFKIAGMSGWMLLTLIIPIVNIVVLIIMYVRFAQAFGKGGGFAVGLILLSFIFIPILAFDDSIYEGVM